MFGFPVIDGHFWIERDGKIVDWDFPQHKECKKNWECGNEKVYLPAPNTVQTLVIKIFEKTMLGVINSKEEFYQLSLLYGFSKPMFGRCYQNCIVDIHLHGGKLIFGSFGWKKKNGNQVHYEYGGLDFKKVADFIKSDLQKYQYMISNDETMELTMCGICKVKAKKTCSRCPQTYCCREHQVEDWKSHKKVCCK